MLDDTISEDMEAFYHYKNKLLNVTDQMNFPKTTNNSTAKSFTLRNKDSSNNIFNHSDFRPNVNSNFLSESRETFTSNQNSKFLSKFN